MLNQIWISGCDVQQRAEADRREVDPPIEVETTSAARLAQLAELLESQAKYDEFKWLALIADWQPDRSDTSAPTCRATSSHCIGSWL
jgi:hypothetical protein